MENELETLLDYILWHKVQFYVYFPTVYYNNNNEANHNYIGSSCIDIRKFKFTTNGS